MSKNMSAISIAVVVCILAITSVAGWVYNYQLQKEIKSLRAESQSWRSFALDATTAYVKSHRGRIPKGTLIWPEPPGKATFLVIGYEEPKAASAGNKEE